MDLGQLVQKTLSVSDLALGPHPTPIGARPLVHNHRSITSAHSHRLGNATVAFRQVKQRVSFYVGCMCES